MVLSTLPAVWQELWGASWDPACTRGVHPISNALPWLAAVEYRGRGQVPLLYSNADSPRLAALGRAPGGGGGRLACTTPRIVCPSSTCSSCWRASDAGPLLIAVVRLVTSRAEELGSRRNWAGSVLDAIASAASQCATAVAARHLQGQVGGRQ